jgi:uncharacterized protein YkwD
MKALCLALLLSLLGVACCQAQSTTEQMIDQTNIFRTQHGLCALTPDATVQASCDRHCAWMASRYSMTHSGGAYAENIAMGQADVTSVTNCWINSPGHRANMLGGYAYCGMSCCAASNGTLFWCQQFSGSMPVLAGVVQAVATPVAHVMARTRSGWGGRWRNR